MKTPARFAKYFILAVGIFAAGYLANRQHDPAVSSASERQASGFICPMHPQYKSDHNGTCPICGMSLVAASTESGMDSQAGEPAQSGMVRIKADTQQLVGVRTDEVRQSSATQVLRVPGRIAVDEQRLYRITAAADGWIRDLGPNAAGSFVKKNQVLASYYAQGLIAAAQTYVFALQTNAQSLNGEATIGYQRGSTVLSLQIATDSLRALGMSEFQIEEIAKTRVAPTKVYVYSPVDGFVIARSISPQQRFDKGYEMYRIADISHVWLMTDIFERDREFLTPGAMATVNYRGRQYEARLSNVLPQFDPQSRTLKTRFELNNPGSVLLPDMFVDAELHVDRPAAITVPADAVIDSGLRKTVYVERTTGKFEPRMIETGWRLGNQVQVKHGLEPGERIVVSGNFLIDSESRMKFADNGTATAAAKTKVKDPVCGMEIDPNSPTTLKVERDGETYYFCADMCKKKFEANPSVFLKKASVKQPATSKDLVCGMEVNPDSPNTFKTEYKGKTYYFCAEDCKKSFEANPAKYVPKAMAAQGMHGSDMAE